MGDEIGSPAKCINICSPPPRGFPGRGKTWPMPRCGGKVDNPPSAHRRDQLYGCGCGCVGSAGDDSNYMGDASVCFTSVTSPGVEGEGGGGEKVRRRNRREGTTFPAPLLSLAPSLSLVPSLSLAPSLSLSPVLGL